jgi:hypothetical protein
MEKRSNEQITFPSEGEKDPLEGQHYGISGARQTKDDYRWDGNMPGRADTESTGVPHFASLLTMYTLLRNASLRQAEHPRRAAQPSPTLPTQPGVRETR